MPEKYPTAREWMTGHPAEYGVLFDDGQLDTQKLQERLTNLQGEGHIALSALARYTETRTRIPHGQSKLIARSVSNILNACQDKVFGEEHAFLGDLDLEGLYSFKNVTSQVIYAWQRACRSYRVASPFAKLYTSDQDVDLSDVENAPIKLVLMTTAALRHVKNYARTTKVDKVPPWVKNVSLYGPLYTREFLDGKRNTLFELQAMYKDHAFITAVDIGQAFYDNWHNPGAYLKSLERSVIQFKETVEPELRKMYGYPINWSLQLIKKLCRMSDPVSLAKKVFVSMQASPASMKLHPLDRLAIGTVFGFVSGVDKARLQEELEVDDLETYVMDEVVPHIQIKI